MSLSLLKPTVNDARKELFDGIYFPISHQLEPFLVPIGTQEIRLKLHCDWIDMRTARHWLAKESTE